MTETPVKLKFLMIYAITVALVLFMTVLVVQAKDQSQLKDKGLDEQVLDIKNEVLAIAKELDQLEERLLYPSHTQVAVYVSLRKKGTFRLDSVDIEFDGKKVAHHLYSPTEVEALNMGAVQRIYTGNVGIGTHNLKVTMRGKTAAGDNILLDKSFPLVKEVEPGIAELKLAESSIALITR